MPGGADTEIPLSVTSKMGDQEEERKAAFVVDPSVDDDNEGGVGVGRAATPEVTLRRRRNAAARRSRRRTRSGEGTTASTSTSTSTSAPSYAVPRKGAIHWRSPLVASGGGLASTATTVGADSPRRRRVLRAPSTAAMDEREVVSADDERRSDSMCSNTLRYKKSYIFHQELLHYFSPFRPRDLSPVMCQMREYLSDADEILEEVLERLVSKAENASAAVVHNASEMVHRSKDAMKNGVHQASEMVHSGVHKANEMVHTKVHQASEMVHNGVGKASEMALTKVHQAEELAKDVYERLRNWKACHYEVLPDWLRDNEHLHFGHRPELKSFAECFRSIFRIHTETGNIWTHLIGFVAFVVVTVVFYVRPLCATCQLDIQLSEKLIFLCFFVGAILCLACSTLFHTVSCHSEFVSAVFSRLDYAGIAFLIVGSIIPWLYYGFYCQPYARVTYMAAVVVLGLATVGLTMWERFNTPNYRVFRTSVFVSLGGVSVVPCLHYCMQNGLEASVAEASMHCTAIMAALYLTGALLYAARIPERFLPGKCDIWFHSHQIFHVLVIAAAFVHYHGISEMAMYRYDRTSTKAQTIHVNLLFPPSF